METPGASTTTPVSLVQRLVNTAWPYIGGRRGLIVLAIGIAVAGAALNWSWLVAVGVAPILLAVLPCAAIGALGLCMNKAGGKSCPSGNQMMRAMMKHQQEKPRNPAQTPKKNKG